MVLLVWASDRCLQFPMHLHHQTVTLPSERSVSQTALAIKGSSGIFVGSSGSSKCAEIRGAVFYFSQKMLKQLSG
jgi:hypothetical protein